ncbi:NF038122 family metalloprotease [Paludisphaera rhizosphaerae]|uniref:NF038122 family metalloprotease n=1 Tax=Paludisphaera rhizosphaerae TaxID=2711216 RepID=UPI0013EAEF56|nr:NF038122 family metalloprotease [Paludisphaera rhizosphaerae]
MLQLPISVIPDGQLIDVGTRTHDLGSFQININADAGLAANSAALAAFQRAAQQWVSRISDPITINISASLANLGGGGIIGQTASSYVAASYNTIRNAMVADAVAGGDPGDAIVASLPTAAQFAAILPTGFSLTGAIALTTANAKALGFTVNAASDASITFNSQFAFDYDNRDGVDAGKMDFETVAAHEIGHALGFVSAVDDVDYYRALGQTASIYLNPLDLYRFQNNVAGRDPSTTSEFTSFARYLNSGGDAITDTIANEWRMSTGAYTGDGNQASHWKADDITGLNIGIMDPTLAFGQITKVGENDLRALSLIGYNISSAAVPEPSSILMLGLGSIVLGGAVRRRTVG